MRTLARLVILLLAAGCQRPSAPAPADVGPPPGAYEAKAQEAKKAFRERRYKEAKEHAEAALKLEKGVEMQRLIHTVAFLEERQATLDKARALAARGEYAKAIEVVESRSWEDEGEEVPLLLNELRQAKAEQERRDAGSPGQRSPSP